MKFSRQAYLSQKAKVTETFNVTLPSGAEFTLCRPNIKAYLSSGQLPTSLVSKMISMTKSPTVAKSALDELSTDETLAMLVYQGAILKDCCVMPKIVDNPKADDELAFTDLADEDIEFIITWAFNAEAGGVEGENASTFRAKQKQRSKARANG